MESNGVETYLDGWGVSIATQRAKERENRTPDVKVIGKTVKQPKLISTGVGRPEMDGCSVVARSIELGNPLFHLGIRVLDVR